MEAVELRGIQRLGFNITSELLDPAIPEASLEPLCNRQQRLSLLLHSPCIFVQPRQIKIIVLAFKTQRRQCGNEYS